MDKKNNKLNEKTNKTSVPLEIQERARRLRFLRKMARLSMKEFAQYCNLGLTTINYWEQGYSSITERGAKKVTKAMREEGIECSTLWLLSGLGEQPKITDPSKLSKINYSSLESSSQAIQEENSDYLYGKIKEELKLFQTFYPDNLVYFVNDESMAPLYCKEISSPGKSYLAKTWNLLME